MEDAVDQVDNHVDQADTFSSDTSEISAPISPHSQSGVYQRNDNLAATTTGRDNSGNFRVKLSLSLFLSIHLSPWIFTTLRRVVNIVYCGMLFSVVHICSFHMVVFISTYFFLLDFSQFLIKYTLYRFHRSPDLKHVTLYRLKIIDYIPIYNYFLYVLDK